MSRNGLRPQPDMPDIPGETEKTDGNRNGARPPKKNKPLRTHYYYD